MFVCRYKVIPLSRRSGLLQWCEGTQPIGDYLIGSPGVRGSGAHAKYRPNDITAMDCRRKMMVWPFFFSFFFWSIFIFLLCFLICHNTCWDQQEWVDHSQNISQFMLTFLIYYRWFIYQLGRHSGLGIVCGNCVPVSSCNRAEVRFSFLAPSATIPLGKGLIPPSLLDGI